MPPSFKRVELLGIALAALAAASMWTYVHRVLQPVQAASAEREGRPRGNLSDLYPRWLGARELLLHGRNPYSREVTREIQVGYYGREIDPSRPSDPKDQVGFAYPLYVAFLLAPFLQMGFSHLQIWAEWFLGAIALAGVLFWERVMGVGLTIGSILSAVLLFMGTYAFVEAVSLQQPVLLVMALVAASFLARNRGRLAVSGVLMAVATIKPQTVLLPVALMLIWVSGEWRQRRRWLWGFGSVLLALFVASEFALPGWMMQFYQAIRAYQAYMAGTAFLDMFLTPHWAWLGRTLIVLGVLWMAWKSRRERVDSIASRQALSLALVGAVCTSPNLGTYNQILLVPGMFLVFEQWDAIGQARVLARSLSRLVLILVLWPWLTSAILVFGSCVFHGDRFLQRAWLLPLYGTVHLPLALFALLCILPAKRSDCLERLIPTPFVAACDIGI